MILDLAAVERRQGWLLPFARAAMRVRVPVRVAGPRPVDPGQLVVCNHVTLDDVPILAVAAGRPMIWLGARTLRDGRLGAALAGLGLIPKTRGMPDAAAARALLRWVKAGAVVALFPEGQRTWDGALNPIPPGLGRLIRVAGVPVVTATIEGGYRYWPRWGRRRRGEVRVRFAPPRTFDGAPAATEAAIARALVAAPAPDLRIRPGTAAGLSNLVARCPTCLERAPTETPSGLTCTCGAAWDLDPELHLVRGSERRGLADVAAAVRARILGEYGAHTTGPALTAPGVTLRDHDRGVIGTGTLELHPDHVALRGTDWRLPLAAVRNCNVEYDRDLELHTADAWYQTTLDRGSAWVWPWSVAWWRDRPRP